MKNKKDKIISIVVCMAIILSCLFALDFNFSAITNNEDNENISTTTNTTTTVTDEITTSSTQDSTTLTSTTTPPDTINPTTTKPVAKPIVVGKISNIKIKKYALKSISLKWSKSKNATNYNIQYRKAGSKSGFKKYKTIKNNSATISNLAPNTAYFVKVTPYATKSNKTYVGKSTTIKVATKTSSIKGLKVTNSNKSISIKWSRNSKVSGYKIYRACSDSNSKYVLQKTIKNNKTTTFTDKKVKNNKVYYYRVKAYCKYSKIGTIEGNLSKSTYTFCGLNAPTPSAKCELGKVSLNWSKSPSASGYRIYQSTKSTGKFSYIGNTKNTCFTTKKLPSNKTYYFKVVSYKNYKGSVVKAANKPKAKSLKVTNTIFGKNVGDTYIEINIKEQHMWYYINDKLYVDTPVVTGNADGRHDTPKGVHHIMVHQTPARLVGPTWDVEVSYWMQFTIDGCGIHDSTWRNSWEYGGTTYLTSGSHGCVNTPLDKVKKIFEKSNVGTTVVVH